MDSACTEFYDVSSVAELAGKVNERPFIKVNSDAVELAGTVNKRPFIKVNSDADERKIVNYIESEWKLKDPLLIVSITGGAKDFSLKQEDRTKVTRRLRKIMGARGTWIISGGTNCGIMKLCGEAAQKHKYDTRDSGETPSEEKNEPIIGIATWGAIPDLEKLMDGANKDFVFEEGVSLDPNHTHFIFVDDGSGSKEFGREQVFRGKLEKALSEKPASKVPIILIVVQGGPGTLKTVEQALINGTSCAVIKGTLGAADAIACIKSIQTETDLEQGYKKAQKLVKSENKMNKMLKSIWDKRERVKVVTLEDEDKFVENIDTSILKILTKNDDPCLKLELAFRWNRDDKFEKILRKVQRNGVQKSEDEKKEQEKLKNTVYEVYHESLKGNFIEFVRNLSDIVDSEDFLEWSLSYDKEHQIDWLGKESEVSSGKLLTSLNKVKKSVSESNLKLFVYSIVHGRLEISEMFWKRLTTGRIAAASFGGLVANEKLETTKGVEKRRRLETIHSFYEANAVELLTVCHDTDVSRAEKLLEKSNLQFEGLTCLELAERANMKKFIAQSACQDVINRMWTGSDDSMMKQTPRNAWILDVASSIVFLFLFSWMCIGNLNPGIGGLEVLVWVFVFTHTLEELRQFVILPKQTIRYKVKDYYFNRWNIADTLALFLFICAVMLRFWNSDVRQWARVFYVTSLQVYFIRFTSVFTLSSYLGPKLVMIVKMVADLGKFFLIALVYIIGYGIAMQALVFPGFNHPAISFFWGILFRPYFEMLGDPDLEGIGAAHLDDCDETPWPYETCPVDKTAITAVAMTLKALFMFFTNVLLLNLLIAIFNNRYEEVERESETLWKYKMYLVVKEYGERPFLPPPFILFAHFWRLAKYVKKFYEEKQDEKNGKGRDIGHDSYKSKEQLNWEEYCFEEMLAIRDKHSRRSAPQVSKEGSP